MTAVKDGRYEYFEKSIDKHKEICYNQIEKYATDCTKGFTSKKYMNDSKVTIYTIAEELGVSPSAVSRAFNSKAKLKQEKRELILQTAAKMGYQPNIMASRLSGEPIRICVILLSCIDAYTHEYLPGIRDAERALSDYKVICDIRVFDKDTYDHQELISLLVDKYDGYIICPWDSYISDSHAFLSSKKPIILLDSNIQECQCTSVSRSDSATSGCIAAQLLAMTVRRPNPHIAIFTSKKDRPSQNRIITSFTEKGKQYSFGDITVLESNDDFEVAERQIIDLCKNHTPDGIYVATANSIPICRFLAQNEQYRDTVLITSDVYAELNDFIRRDVVTATIFQNPYQQAYNSLSALALHLINGEPIPPEILVDPVIVLKSNLHLYENTDM